METIIERKIEEKYKEVEDLIFQKAEEVWVDFKKELTKILKPNKLECSNTQQ